MANWTNETQPFGANRAPLLEGLSATDGITPVPVAVDPATGRLLTNTTGGATTTSVAINDGVTTTRKATVANLTNANPLAVEIVDASGNQITSFGGGTQYTDGGTPPANPIGPTLIWDSSGTWKHVGTSNPLPVTGGGGGTQYTNGSAQATPTGTVALGWDTANVRALSTDSSGKLNINTVAGTVTVSGTVTANAGTNLNTSALALESGGNLAGINGKISTAAALADGTANPTVGGIQDFPMVWNGTTWDRLRGTGVAGVPRVGVGDWNGNQISAFPATFMRTTDEPHQLFYDAFDSSTLDTTNRWTSSTGSNGVAAANSAGVMSMGTGTTANGYSKLASQPLFTLPIPAWLGASDAIALPDGAAPTANSYRYWGTGTTPTIPTVSAPVTDGYGFELNTDGKMRAVVYAGGTRTVVQDLSTSGNSTQPLDANYHRYIIYIRTDKAYWYIDGITSTNLVATSNFNSSQVQGLPRLFLAIGNSTPPASNTQIQCTGATAWDTGKNNFQLSDGTFPWRKATVSAAGAVSTSLVSGATIGIDQTVTGNNRVSFGSIPQKIDNTSVGGNDTATVAPGTQLVALAGPTGDPYDSTGNALNVNVNNLASVLASGAPESATSAQIGWKPFFNASVSNTVLGVKTSAGNLYGLHATNYSNAGVNFIQFFNKPAGAVVLGSTVPDFVLTIPAGGAIDNVFPLPYSFSIALSIAVTLTITGSGAPTITSPVNLWYS